VYYYWLFSFLPTAYSCRTSDFSRCRLIVSNANPENILFICLLTCR
jgi:hypothetical protein